MTKEIEQQEKELFNLEYDEFCEFDLKFPNHIMLRDFLLYQILKELRKNNVQNCRV